jgi:hypothetical protein
MQVANPRALCPKEQQTMSIEASYRRITAEEFAHLQENPKTAETFFDTNWAFSK